MSKKESHLVLVSEINGQLEKHDRFDDTAVSALDIPTIITSADDIDPSIKEGIENFIDTYDVVFLMLAQDSADDYDIPEVFREAFADDLSKSQSLDDQLGEILSRSSSAADEGEYEASEEEYESLDDPEKNAVWRAIDDIARSSGEWVSESNFFNFDDPYMLEKAELADYISIKINLLLLAWKGLNLATLPSIRAYFYEPGATGDGDFRQPLLPV